ncbi:hypothetical protein DQ04_14941010 [Trypanosoma grayi]|uniref:hypothetical protein n=1 Tax=Trypanosoma grayi TaxID=71804 RepID=UPI0004F488A9|nr:hypothetical protein DQ04_14941010 [Trypanosoma grayi]KEG06264.1 hypothetical protein DQ04_14941010 [Trypanosoma grayi]
MESQGENVTDEDAIVEEMDRSLTKVRHFLQQRVPYGSIREPNAPPQSSSSSAPCCRETEEPSSGGKAPVYPVDAFLYLEEDVEELVERGCISREYCRACGSVEIGLTDFITHSFSQDQLVFLSCYLLPALSDASYAVTQDWCLRRRNEQSPDAASPFTCRHVVDVGSRLGVVPLSCYFAAQQQRLRATQRVTGIELDGEMVELQRTVLKRFASKPASLQVDIIHSNCFEGAGEEALRDADVVILHNVFEYFTETPVEHLRSWCRLREIVARRGQLLICSPSLEETFASFTPEHMQVVMNSSSGGNSLLASEASAQQHVDGNTRKRSRDEQESKEGVFEQWCQSWVTEIDVAELREAFLVLRQAGCNCHDDHSSCGEVDKELEEGLRHMRVYVVK